MKTWLLGLSWKKRIGVGAGALLVLFLLLCGIGYAVTDVPPPNKIAIEQATRVLYADGTEMGRIGTNRQIVPLDKISKDAQHAVLAAENRDFYSEPGISPKGIARALFSNVKAGGTTQGGSTITQQYAKNAFLTQDRTYTRKVKEVFIALKMSRTTDKDTILESYLNTIYFGRGAYGIEAAATTYFGPTVHAKDLNAAQAALLASSIRSPAAYDPQRHPERAKDRWEYVLDGMVEKKWLSSGDRQAAKYPRVAPPGNRNFPGSLDYVRERVVAELARHGFPEDRVTAGGLIVHTTLRKAAQEAAVTAVEEEMSKALTGDNRPVGALVAVQPGTGRVIAYYGGKSAGGFDYAGDGKGVQPGSSMKPYVLAAAIEKGTNVDSRLNGASPQEICGTEISNDEGDPPFGQIDLATGLAHSVNTVYYRLACETGAERVADAAHAAGIPDSQKLVDEVSGKPTAQIALGAGGYEIHVIDQAVGYATFAAKGTRATPYFVQNVTDRSNNVLYKAKNDTGMAFSEGVSADVTYAMQKVVQEGTGTRAQLDGRPVAGKTGTTGSNANAWFAGFTPQLSTAVWVGRPKGGPLKGVFPDSPGGVYGGNIPAKIFKAFMDEALKGAEVIPFPPKAGVGKVTGSPTATATTTSTPSPTPAPSFTPPGVIKTKEPKPTKSPDPVVSSTSSPAASPVSSPAASP